MDNQDTIIQLNRALSILENNRERPSIPDNEKELIRQILWYHFDTFKKNTEDNRYCVSLTQDLREHYDIMVERIRTIMENIRTFTLGATMAFDYYQGNVIELNVAQFIHFVGVHHNELNDLIQPAQDLVLNLDRVLRDFVCLVGDIIKIAIQKTLKTMADIMDLFVGFLEAKGVKLLKAGGVGAISGALCEMGNKLEIKNVLKSGFIFALISFLFTIFFALIGLNFNRREYKRTFRNKLCPGFFGFESKRDALLSELDNRKIKEGLTMSAKMYWGGIKDNIMDNNQLENFTCRCYTNF